MIKRLKTNVLRNYVKRFTKKKAIKHELYMN